MNTVLIIFILYNTTFVPEFAINYATEQQCLFKSKDYAARPNYQRIAKCIEPNEVKLNDGEIIALSDEQIILLGLKDSSICERTGRPSTTHLPKNKSKRKKHHG